MDILLPSIISSGMVIEKRARIRGMCEGGDSVEIRFRGKTFNAPVVNGKWEVTVESASFGGPFEMRIGHNIILTDVYVGYVFMLSGQSNMEMPAGRVRIKYEDDFKDLVRNPRIRAFQIERPNTFNEPQFTCNGHWREIDPDTIDSFFAVTHYLAKKLGAALDAPIGFIECAVGGSRIESWMSEDSLKYEGYAPQLLQMCRREGFVDRLVAEDAEAYQMWHENVKTSDVGLTEKFYADDCDFQDAPVRQLTKNWAEDIGLHNGVVWFRRTFAVKPEMAGKAARIFMGTITDSDTIFINGELVGHTEYQYPPRVYPVREGLLREGENTITVRVVCERQYGGFTAGKEYCITADSGVIDLNGEWAYKIGCKVRELPTSVFIYRLPCLLYNTMLAPVLPYDLSAFIWYQGESNAQDPHSYGRLLARFLGDLRENYGEGLPFLAVQLPNYNAGEQNANWQSVQEHQASVLEHTNTALIITDDIGEDNDIHPLNKRDVAFRLAEGVLCLLRGDAVLSDKVKVSLR